jgi:hypothetical protein
VARPQQTRLTWVSETVGALAGAVGFWESVILMNKVGRRRLGTAILIAGLVVVGLASLAIVDRSVVTAAGSGSGESKCKQIDEPVRSVSAPIMRKAVLCLLNEERRRHARKPVVRSKALQQAAQNHTKTMVATDCLSHQCPGEPTLETRVRRTGYFQGASAWGYAENTGCGLNAEAMVANWMASRFHRINILGKDFRDLGVGFIPQEIEGRCDDGYGAFVLVLGFRKG